MTLKRLRYRHVQIHESLDVDMSPGITTLIGPSDSGKTAALRGVKLLALNEPSADSLTSHGSNSISVRAEFDDGTPTITRKRDKKFNGYGIGDEILNAIGRGVPAPITDALRLTEDNFQSQMDAPYWLSLTPGDRAKRFNEVVDLSSIDRALSGAAARVKTTTQRTQDAETRLKAAVEEVASLAYVADAEADVVELEAFDAAIYRTTKRIETLETRIGEWEKWNNAIETREAGLVLLRQLVVTARSLEASKARCEKIESVIRDLDSIDAVKYPGPAWRNATRTMIATYKATVERLGACQQAIDQYATTETPRPNPAAVAATYRLIATLRETRQRLEAITSAIDGVQQADRSLNAAALEVSRCRTDLDLGQQAVNDAVSRMPPPARCETCLRPL